MCSTDPTDGPNMLSAGKQRGRISCRVYTAGNFVCSLGTSCVCSPAKRRPRALVFPGDVNPCGQRSVPRCPASSTRSLCCPFIAVLPLVYRCTKDAFTAELLRTSFPRIVSANKQMSTQHSRQLPPSMSDGGNLSSLFTLA
uniref:Uncharacterized protein n=1 Tax=Ixodes ricinus TaxID=34613 RepID=A0A6B0UTC0_IXORI